MTRVEASLRWCAGVVKLKDIVDGHLPVLLKRRNAWSERGRATLRHFVSPRKVGGSMRLLGKRRQSRRMKLKDIWVYFIKD